MYVKQAKYIYIYIYIYGAGALRGPGGNERPVFWHLVLDLCFLRLCVNKESQIVLLITIGFSVKHIGFTSRTYLVSNCCIE